MNADCSVDGSDGSVCCQAYEAECMACADGVNDVVAWCKAHKDFDGTGCDDASLNPQIDCKTCPQGFNDGCNTCSCDSAGQTMCTAMACFTVGKPFCIPEEPDAFCCQGLYADCMACEAGQDPLTFCLEKANLGVDGCEVYHESKPDETSVGGGCCKAFTAQCNACMTGESIAEYCSHNLDVIQCPEWMAFSRSDLAETIRRQIDAWLQGSKAVNEFGDAIDTSYPGGSPLFDETTGESYDLYEYVAMNHADAPWRVEDPTDMCCFAYMPECLACAEGVDVVTWCTAHKDFEGTGCESVWSNLGGNDSGTNAGGNDVPIGLSVGVAVGGAVFAGAVLAVFLKRRNPVSLKKGVKLEDEKEGAAIVVHGAPVV